MRWMVIALLVVPASVWAQVHVDVKILVPPSPPPVVEPAPPVAPAPSVAVAPPPVERRHIPAVPGIVLTVDSGRILHGALAQGAGVSLLAHPIEDYPFEISFDYQRDGYDSDGRVDHRIGYTLIIGSTTKRLSPYVVIPMGVNIVVRDALDTKAQGYVGIGGGGKLRLGDWALSVDARVLSRSENSSDDEVMPLPSETVLEAHANVAYVF
jgi:hypothetical protein